MRCWRGFRVAAGFLIMLAGCNVSAVKPSGSSTPVSFSALHDRGTMVVDQRTAMVHFDVDEFSFKPTFVDVAPGTTLTLELANDGTEQHSFVIANTAVAATIDAGSSITRQASFPNPGTYVFYCQFHRGLGMQGAVVVNAPVMHHAVR